jgi:predicted Zn-dependent protease
MIFRPIDLAARVRLRLIVLGLVVVALALGRSAAAQGQPGRVLVLTFESDAGLPRTYWLGEAVTLLTIDELAALGLPVLTRDQRLEVFDELRVPAGVALTRATLLRVAHLVGAEEIVEGSVAVDGAEVTVRARSLLVQAGRYRTEITERGPAADLVAVSRRVARHLARDAGATISDNVVRRDGEVPLDAFELYVKGVVAGAADARIRLLRAAIEKYPGYDRARLALWEAQAEAGDHQFALQAARGVPAASPLARDAQFAAARSLIELHQYEEAYATLTGLADAKAAPGVLNNLGVVQLRRGGGAEAGSPAYFFHRAAELDPDDPDLFFNLGYAYALARDANAAIYWLREAVRRDPSDSDAHYVLGVALLSHGADAEAVRERELARRLSARYEDESRPGEPLARNLERVKDSPEPLHTVRFDRGLAEAAEPQRRDMARLQIDEGERYYAQHKDSEALGAVRRALFLSPYDRDALLLLARIQLRTGHVRDAAESARVALWAGETAAGHVVLGQALVEARDVAGARAEVDRALALEPDSAEARALLSRINALAR